MGSINTITKPLLALLVLSLVAAAVYAALTLGPFQVNVSVGAPLSVAPGSYDVSLFAGESTQKVFTITNLANVEIDVVIAATVTGVPQGGLIDDITLTYSPTTTVLPHADTEVQIGISVSQSALAGSYTISVTVTR